MTLLLAPSPLAAVPIGPPPPAPDLPNNPPPIGPVPAPPPVVDPPATEPPMTDPGKPAPIGDPAPGLMVAAESKAAAGVTTAAAAGTASTATAAAAAAAAAVATTGASKPAVPASLSRFHARRLREIYRSAGWPCCDMVEIELLAAGLLERVRSASGHESLRVTDAGVAHIATSLALNRAGLSRHEALVERIAREMTRSGRIAWRGLSLRARLPSAEGEPARWCMARPDVFSIRNTSVEAYAQPLVHEIKVSRADLLADLRKPDKRAAYQDLGGECWYVLGCDARRRPIGEPDEVPVECGVLIAHETRLEVARSAVHRPLPRIPFGVWLALAKARPQPGFEDDVQACLGEA